MKQGTKVSHITFWLNFATAKQRLNRKMRRSGWSNYQKLFLYLLPWHNFLHTVWSWPLLLWQNYGQSRLDILDLYKFLSLRGHPHEKTGDGGSVVGENSIGCLLSKHTTSTPSTIPCGIRSQSKTYIKTSEVEERQLWRVLTWDLLDDQIMGGVENPTVHNGIVGMMKNRTTVER